MNYRKVMNLGVVDVFTSSIENGNLINAKVSILIESIAQSRKDRIVDEYLH